MGYFVRILTPSTAAVSAAALLKSVKSLPEIAITFSGPKAAWQSVFVGANPTPGASPIVSIERNSNERDSLGKEELGEFDQAMKKALPASGAKWVRAYLKKVRTIYAVQFHSEAAKHAAVVGAVIEALRAAVGGIVQADANGFTNEAGDCVVWQFPEDAVGPWTMAVLEGRKWVTFEMDLGNAVQRKAFLQGEVPGAAKRPAPAKKPAAKKPAPAKKPAAKKPAATKKPRRSAKSGRGRKTGAKRKAQ
jgi:hypothetical protein